MKIKSTTVSYVVCSMGKRHAKSRVPFCETSNWPNEIPCTTLKVLDAIGKTLNYNSDKEQNGSIL